MHVCGVKMPMPFNHESIDFKDLFIGGREFYNKKWLFKLLLLITLSLFVVEK